MTNRGIAVLALRLFALYLFVHSLIALPEGYAALANGPTSADAVQYWLLAAAHAGPVIVGVFLWFCAGPLATVILPQRTFSTPPPVKNSESWYGPAFAAVGLLVSIDALPQLLELLAEYRRTTLALENPTPAFQVALAAKSLQTGLGLAVLLGSRGFANLIARLRTGGLSSDAELAPEQKVNRAY